MEQSLHGKAAWKILWDSRALSWLLMQKGLLFFPLFFHAKTRVMLIILQ